jgi:hypothetical protein
MPGIRSIAARGFPSALGWCAAQMPSPLPHNTLFYGENLPILRERLVDASVDLVSGDLLVTCLSPGKPMNNTG